MLEPGAHIGEWIVDGPLGTGTSVWRAHLAADAGRVAALKEVGSGSATGQVGLAERGRALTALDHPGLVRVLGLLDGIRPPVLAMCMVEGEKLSTRIRASGPLPVNEATPLFEGLAAAVAQLHAQGLHHGDLKPQNVVLDASGASVIVDLGREPEPSAAARAEVGLRMDTVSYVPPEWSAEGPINGARWDVYSLGAMFWEVLVGRRAFPLPDDQPPDEAALQVMAEKAAHPPLDPGPDTPFFLRVLIRDMTHFDPAQRPESAGEVLIRLQAGNAGSLVDPTELFRTPMPAWQVAEELQSGGGSSDQLSSSMIPASPDQMQGPEPAWWRSFASGAIAGGFLVALVFVAFLGWALGSGWLPVESPRPPLPAPAANP